MHIHTGEGRGGAGLQPLTHAHAHTHAHTHTFTYTQVKAGGDLGYNLYKCGIAKGHENFEKGIIGGPMLANMLVFKKVQAVLGGRLKACITGGAPLKPEIQKWAQTALNMPVRQGYGLTETCAASVIGKADCNKTSIIGPPTVASCIKLEDCVLLMCC